MVLTKKSIAIPKSQNNFIKILGPKVILHKKINKFLIFLRLNCHPYPIGLVWVGWVESLTVSHISQSQVNLNDL
jgi:hypothetical protein